MISFFLRFYLGISATFLFSLTVMCFYFGSQYEGALKEEHVRIAKALNAILEPRLCGAKPDEVSRIVDELSTEYSYHIELTNYQDLSLFLRQKMDTNSFHVNIQSGFITDLIEVYYVQSCIPSIVKFKPNADYNSFYNVLIGLTLVFVLVAFGIAVGALALPVFRHINSMLRSTYAIANGNFKMKADESAPAPLNELAFAINYVASQISELIAEQEMLTSAASHELNTPLMRMNFVLDIAIKTDDPDTLKAHLLEIRDDLNQLGELVVEILDYSKFKFNANDLKLSPFYLLPLLFRVRNNLSKLRADVLVEITCPNNLQINACEKSIERVVGNLIRNAQKYAHSLLKVEVFKADSEIIINVVDDGPGIPDAMKMTVLKPFFRIDSSRSRDTGGAGLGLAIVNKICFLHQAKLVLEDNQYGGLTVKMHFNAETC